MNESDGIPAHNGREELKGILGHFASQNPT